MGDYIGVIQGGTWSLNPKPYIVGVIKGDTRSLDNGSCIETNAPLQTKPCLRVSRRRITVFCGLYWGLPPFGETDIDAQEAGKGTRRIEEVDPDLQQAQCHVRRLHMP